MTPRTRQLYSFGEGPLVSFYFIVTIFYYYFIIIFIVVITILFITIIIVIINLMGKNDVDQEMDDPVW